MKESARRKDLVREYKEKKPRPGIFAVRCSATGTAWIGAAKNLDTQKNGVWFQLQMGSHMNRILQDAWNRHGADTFSFDVLEEIADDNAQMIDLLLKERAAHWRGTLGAEKIVG